MKLLSIFLFFISTSVFSMEMACQNAIKENTPEEYKMLIKKALNYQIHYFSKEKSQEAFCIFSQLAEHGYIDAQAALATFYEYGEIVPKNAKKALEMLINAAEKGSSVALNNLGSYYFNGISAPQDLEKAISYYRQAIDSGDITAKLGLSFAYFFGQGVPQNKEYAIELALEVTKYPEELAYEIATTYLGFYYSSLGLKDKAIFWAEKAAEKGYPEAQVNLGVLYANNEILGNAEKSLYWFNRSMERGNPEAYFKLASIYENGTKFFKQDSEKAFELFKKAAELDHGISQYNIGVKLFNGAGVNKNEKEGIKWYLKAANENNILVAMISLHNIYNQGTKEIPQDLEKAKYWLEKARENGLNQ